MVVITTIGSSSCLWTKRLDSIDIGTLIFVNVGEVYIPVCNRNAIIHMNPSVHVIRLHAPKI